MLYYLDSNIVIFAVEGQPADKLRSLNHIATLEAAGHCFGISELVSTECLIHPLRNRDGALLLDFQEFLVGPHVVTVTATTAVHFRAAAIRARFRFGLADSIHLAAAVEHRFDRFLTNDQRLAAFTEIPVELLP